MSRLSKKKSDPKPVSPTPLVVNLFGAPGAGKQTASAYLLAMLRMEGVYVEEIREFGKDRLYRFPENLSSHLQYAYGRACLALDMLADSVDVVITDSPLPTYMLSSHPKDFDEVCIKKFDSYNNLNILIDRVKGYDPRNRMYTERESDRKAEEIQNLLKMHSIKHTVVNGDLDGCNEILSLIFDALSSIASAEDDDDIDWLESLEDLAVTTDDIESIKATDADTFKF